MISQALIASWTRMVRNVCSTLFVAARPSRHGCNEPLNTKVFSSEAGLSIGRFEKSGPNPFHTGLSRSLAERDCLRISLGV